MTNAAPIDLTTQAAAAAPHVDTPHFVLVVLATVLVAGILGALTAADGSRAQKALICAFGGFVVSTGLYTIYLIFSGTIIPQ